MIARFPDPLEFIHHLKAAMLAVSDDPTKPHLHVVRIELDTNTSQARFIATGGSWMWLSEVHCGPPVTGIDDKDNL